ncbi:hypothetical protein [Pedosphaera parvula]|uniref:Neutral/alkaline non-lysosomal ceramidase N-terminal domain-containing protein n=1 Tax=Pedosphaera parvula (strain Ellin514) TaxID=320771 RepID=B9XAJ8_PEDPL|nr:hypothetical protein [Pedosphaera parvula]EEF63033.1 hypothetical protein Cflav_PD5668 [Pedosphaera parvula Ellin514]
MKVGTAQINISPQPGIDLAGFAVRAQPCQRVLDPLWVRVLYLEEGAEKLLWIHGDVLAFDDTTVSHLRDWVVKELGIPATKVVVAATHTHSGPATIQLTGCGKVDAGYVVWLQDKFREAVWVAVENIETCHLMSTEGECRLGVDRLNSAFNHTDPRVGAFGWRRKDGSYKAVMLSYSMHPVSLKEPLASGDWPGETARFLTAALPGRPVVIVSSGACGNINPPQVGVTPEQTYQWGRHIAQSVLSGLLSAPLDIDEPAASALKMTTVTVDLPLESWSGSGIEKYADECLADAAGHREFGVQFPKAIETWRTSMLQRHQRSEPPHLQAVLGILSLGRATVLTVNAEIFSRFTDLVSSEADGPVYTMGCANGMIGYLASAEAYLEHGYEVSWSMLFYNKPRLQKGGLELLAEQARRLLERGPAGKSSHNASIDSFHV